MSSLIQKFRNLFGRAADASALKSRSLSLKRLLVGLLTIILVFVLGFGVAIYVFKKDNSAVERVANIVPYPAVIVNGRFISLRNYYFTRTFTQHFYTASKVGYDAASTNQQVIDQLIDQELVAQHAKAQHVSVSSSEVDQAYQKLIEKNGQDEVNKVLSDLYGLSESQFKNLIYDQVLKQKLESALKDKGAWHQVQVRHLLVKVDQNADQKTVDAAKAKADKDLADIKGGKSFDEVAKANSEDAESKDQGGELGYVSRGQTVKEFEAAIFAAKKGDLLGPIRTQYGWHIISIEDVRGDNDYQIWRDQSSIHTLIKV